MVKKKTKRRYTRKKKRPYRKRRQMGLFAKIGVGIAVGGPLGLSALSAAQVAQNTSGTMFKKLEMFFKMWLGNLGAMFGLESKLPSDSAVKGIGWSILFTGALLTAIDIAIAKLTKTSMRVGGVAITGRY